MDLPEGRTPSAILPTLIKKAVIFAGGPHKEIATEYIRFGHMGVSVMDQGRGAEGWIDGEGAAKLNKK